MKHVIGSKKVLYMRNDAEAAEFVSKNYGEYHNKEDFKILYVKQLDKKVYGINCHEVFYEYNVYEKSDRIAREQVREAFEIEEKRNNDINAEIEGKKLTYGIKNKD